MEELKIFAPATVANLSCGFDVLGCCLDSIGDEMTIRKNSENKVRITRITGQDLPLETRKNVAGVAAETLLRSIGSNQGFDIEIDKKIKPGSGIGSSAASAAGVVVAINKMLGEPCNTTELISYAMQGEVLASGNAHADNVAPAIMGGFSLVRSYEPLEVIGLPAPSDLRLVILHPQIEIKTRDSRSILKQEVELKKAIQQWGNLGAFISALYTENYELLGRSLKDEIIEPVRAILIPYFMELKQLTEKNEALGFGISGSGPSVFAMCRGQERADHIVAVYREFYSNKELDFDIHVSGINQSGVKIL